MSSVKESLRDIVDQLPDECTWDEVMDRIYVRQKIEAGLADEVAGRTVTHQDVFSLIGKSEVARK
jgi:predicted transcriptional regulator